MATFALDLKIGDLENARRSIAEYEFPRLKQCFAFPHGGSASTGREQEGPLVVGEHVFYCLGPVLSREIDEGHEGNPEGFRYGFARRVVIVCR